MLWNQPTYYIWQQVVTWACSILPLIGDPILGRIVRTNESGFQILWMQFRTEEGAQRFPGVVQGLLLGPDDTLTLSNRMTTTAPTDDPPITGRTKAFRTIDHYWMSSLTRSADPLMLHHPCSRASP